jgi:hypothetical protein
VSVPYSLLNLKPLQLRSSGIGFSSFFLLFPTVIRPAKLGYCIHRFDRSQTFVCLRERE